MQNKLIRLFYEDMGQGKAFVFLHGYPLDHSTWMPAATLLKGKARCVLPDLRGLGKSPVTGTETTISQMADDVINLLDELKIDKACFIGHSMGGYVAMQIVRAHSDRVFGLGLVATRAEPDSPETVAERMSSREIVLSIGSEALIKTMAERLTDRPSIRQEIIPVMQKTSPQGIAMAQYAMAHRDDASEWLKNLPFPIVAAAGGKDVITPESELRSLCQSLKLGYFYSSPTASHMLPMEEPELIARALDETFLQPQMN